jgi:glutamyl-tRNA synthetase
LFKINIPNSHQLTINDLRLILLNYIFSKQEKEDLIVYVNDLVKNDFSKDIEEKNLELLSLFSIDYKNIIHQSNNIKYHTQMAMSLILERHAFNCFCSEAAIENDKEQAKNANKKYHYTDFCLNLSDEAKFECNAPFTVRIKRPQKNISYNDINDQKIEIDIYDVDSFNILNQDKSPTNDFATAIDDMINDISGFIEDDTTNFSFAKQLHIRNILGYDKQLNYKQVSKINDPLETTVKSLINDGFLPEAIANYLLMISFNTEINSIEESIDFLDLKKLETKELSFDIERLKELNTEYIKKMDDMRLSKILGFADNDIGKLAKLNLDYSYSINSLKIFVEYVFNNEEKQKNYDNNSRLIKKIIQESSYIDNYHEFFSLIEDKSSLDKDDINLALNLLIKGSQDGPSMEQVYPYIKNYLGEII